MTPCIPLVSQHVSDTVGVASTERPAECYKPLKPRCLSSLARQRARVSLMWRQFVYLSAFYCSAFHFNVAKIFFGDKTKCLLEMQLFIVQLCFDGGKLR